MEESDLQGQLLELMFSRSAVTMKPNAITRSHTHSAVFLCPILNDYYYYSLLVFIDIMAAVESEHTTAIKGQ